MNHVLEAIRRKPVPKSWQDIDIQTDGKVNAYTCITLFLNDQVYAYEATLEQEILKSSLYRQNVKRTFDGLRAEPRRRAPPVDRHLPVPGLAVPSLQGHYGRGEPLRLPLVDHQHALPDERPHHPVVRGARLPPVPREQHPLGLQHAPHPTPLRRAMRRTRPRQDARQPERGEGHPPGAQRLPEPDALQRRVRPGDRASPPRDRRRPAHDLTGKRTRPLTREDASSLW